MDEWVCVLSVFLIAAGIDMITYGLKENIYSIKKYESRKSVKDNTVYIFDTFTIKILLYSCAVF